MTVLENYFIQLFQNNNITVNEQTQSTATSRMHLETLHTLHSLPSTNVTEHSVIFPLIAHTLTLKTQISKCVEFLASLYVSLRFIEYPKYSQGPSFLLFAGCQIFSLEVRK